jgi:hypothetical protein
MLLDAAATMIVAVSPDEQRVLVSSQYPASDLELVTIGGPTTTLAAASPGVWGGFSPDGRSILFTRPLQSSYEWHLARADGTGARLLTVKSDYNQFAGRWLYYEDENSPTIAFYRLLPPDGEPQLLATFDPPHAFPSGSFSAVTSPDGESVAYCHSPSAGAENCFLLAAGSTRPVTLPGAARVWSPDGRWLLSGFCEMVDLSGSVREVCDPQVESAGVSPDGKTLAIVSLGSTWPPSQSSVHIRLHSVATGTDVMLPTPPFDGGVYRPAFFFQFTPDGSRVIAFLGASAFSAPVAGGPWTQIVSDGPPIPHRGEVYVSLDSRIIAVPSESLGLVESINGAPPATIGAFFGVAFEPPGGLGKALFISEYQDAAVLANANGSGDPLQLPRIGECNWVDRAALCLRWSSGKPNQLVVVTDEGQQLSVTSHDTSNWRTTGQLTAHRLFYVSYSGGLCVMDYRKP